MDAGRTANSGQWKTVELFVPSRLNQHDVERWIDDQLRVIACEAGEFISSVRIRCCDARVANWHRYQVAYLPGPPGTVSVDV